MLEAGVSVIAEAGLAGPTVAADSVARREIAVVSFSAGRLPADGVRSSPHSVGSGVPYRRPGCGFMHRRDPREGMKNCRNHTRQASTRVWFNDLFVFFNGKC